MDLKTKIDFNPKVPYIEKCGMCHKEYTIFVYPGDVNKYQTGQSYVQDIFPYLSADERELIISKTCGTCWEDLWGEEEE